jgi:hypothetical protein
LIPSAVNWSVSRKDDVADILGGLHHEYWLEKPLREPSQVFAEDRSP